MSALDEYRAVVAKVDAFAGAVARRRAADMECRAGCDACCRVKLSVSLVEAEAIRELLARSPRELPRRVADDDDDRCAMLDDEGRCAIYEARPLVCRTQGLPLRYPPGFVPLDAVRASAAGDVTWCPLNFTRSAPRAEDVLDAERADAMLAIVNRRFAEATDRDPLARVALADLVAT